MNYNADDLFKIIESDREAIIMQYREKTYSAITELEIPEKYNGKPVVCLWDSAFEGAEYLKSVRLPKSIREIRPCAFWNCPELERVELNSAPTIFRNAIGNCPKLPPEMIVMGLVGSADITRPFPVFDLGKLEGFVRVFPDDCFRPDVFALLLKNDSFRDFGLERALNKIIDNNMPQLFPIAEQCGVFENSELLDRLINYSVEKKKVESTAVLLELKKRKFGFTGFGGGDDFKL